MAQGWFNFYTASTKGTSAGTSPLAQNVFHHPTPEAIEVMREEGVDISEQPVTALTPEIAKTAERIVVLCQPSDAPDYIHNHPNVIFNELEDPFGKTIDVYRSVREEIRLFIQTLLPKNELSHPGLNLDSARHS